MANGVSQATSSSKLPPALLTSTATRLAKLLSSLAPDPRSLALFRILLGLLLLADWARRWADIPAFYCDAGISPRIAGLDWGGGVWTFSIFHAAGSEEMVRLLFLLFLLPLIGFTIGYHTRTCTWLTLLYYTGIVNRTLILRHGGDVVIIVMLLWAAFLPIASHFSLDRKLQRILPVSPFHLAAPIILLQLALIYLSTAAMKHGSDWTSGHALYWAWSLDQFSSPFGQYLASHLPLPFIQYLTWSTLAIEWLIPILILWPHPYTRLAAIALTFLLFVPIALTLHVGDFPYVMLACSALLIPREVWNRTTFHLSPPHPALPFTKVSIASNLAVLIIAITAAINCHNFNLAPALRLPTIPMPPFLQPLILIPQAYQDWGMFAPNVAKNDGWLVFDGLTEDGQDIDPFTMQPVSFLRPTNLAGTYGRYWMKIYERITQPQYEAHRLWLARWLTRRYNVGKEPSTRLKTFRIYFMRRTIPPPSSNETIRTSAQLLWTHQCLDPS